MSGHNKWSKIKRQKGASDAARSNAWGKLAKRIAVESKLAKGDVDAPALRAMIERAVQKGISADAASLEHITYETYGPGGAAIIIQTVTDSRNRTAQEIKH